MKMKRYLAKDMREAMQKVRQEWGPNAVILSNQTTADGVELVAAIDMDDAKSPHPTKPDLKQPSDSLRQTAASYSPFASLEAEVQSLRQLLEQQLSGLIWQQSKSHNAVQVSMMQRLLRLGLTIGACKILLKSIEQCHMVHAWPILLQNLQNHILVDKPLLDKTGVLAMIGPTGVGKTTTLAKLAAYYSIQHGSQTLGLASTDSYRIGAHEQLSTYGRLLDIPVYLARQASELSMMLSCLNQKQLILLDTAGITPQDERLQEHILLLSQSIPVIHWVLVLSATSQYSSMVKTLEYYRRVLGESVTFSLIFTKLDEATYLGHILSFLINYGLPVAYITNGQLVPEDIHSAIPSELVGLALRLTEENPACLDDIHLARAYAGIYGEMAHEIG